MAEPGQRDQFGRVDDAPDPGVFVRFLDVAAAMDTIRVQRERTYALLAVRAGDHLLDAGCGLGDVVRALARLVGAGGRVVGVDTSDVMLAQARERSRGQDLPIEFQRADITRLPFPDASFAGSRAERVLEHLAAPEHAVAELARVTRPGGRVVVVSPDTGTYTMDAPGLDERTTRAILHEHGQRQAQPWMGRRLYSLFRAAGLAEVTAEGHTHPGTELARVPQIEAALRKATERARTGGAITEAEGAAWWQALEAGDRAGLWFGSTTHFVVAGTKP